jgi:hypothetical protein
MLDGELDPEQEERFKKAEDACGRGGLNGTSGKSSL